MWTEEYKKANREAWLDYILTDETIYIDIIDSFDDERRDKIIKLMRELLTDDEVCERYCDLFAFDIDPRYPESR